MTITGSNFTGATAVDFGLLAATGFTVSSNGSSITATSPAALSGTVNVTVTTPTGTSAVTGGIAPAGPNDQFTVGSGVPAVMSITPSTGGDAGGTTVTITGSNFVAGATTVSFGGAAATSVNVVNPGQLTAVSPAVNPGVVDVTVTTTQGTSATGSADRFTYALSVPAVIAVSPYEGAVAGGTPVTVTGIGFFGVTSVHFNHASAASFTVNSSTSITAVSPQGFDGTGYVTITVTTAGGTSPPTSGGQFIYGPTINPGGVSPSSGPPTGGTPVTISGTGFQSDGGVSNVGFGPSTTPAESFTVVSDTEIQAVTPPCNKNCSPAQLIIVMNGVSGQQNLGYALLSGAFTF